MRGAAVADGTVVVHATLGIEATNPGTGIDALVLDTGLVVRALRVQGALGTTAGREAIEPGQAGAHGLVIGGVALGIGSTGRGITGSQRSYRG